MDKLTETDTVVSVSAGNSGAWAENSYNGELYADDVNFHTGGSPGAYANAFTVASVDNAGMIGSTFRAADRDVVYTETLYYNAALSSMDTSEDGAGTTLRITRASMSPAKSSLSPGVSLTSPRS